MLSTANAVYEKVQKTLVLDHRCHFLTENEIENAMPAFFRSHISVSKWETKSQRKTMPQI